MNISLPSLALLLSLAALGRPAHGSTGGVTVASGDLNGDGLDLSSGFPMDGMTLHGIDPDEIDFASTSAPTIRVEGLTLHGIDPDEIDLAAARDLLAATGPAWTREHVMLARQVGTPDARGGTTTKTIKTTGRLLLEIDVMTLREEVVSTRPNEARLVADLDLVVVGVSMADADLQPEAWMATDTELSLAAPGTTETGIGYLNIDGIAGEDGPSGGSEPCEQVCVCTEDGIECYAECL